ncbi:hypothetical protein D3C86_1230380 [compost metagenome]
MVAEVCLRRRDWRTDGPLSAAQSVEVSVNIGLTQEQGIPLPCASRPQTTSGVEHRPRSGGDHGVVQQTPKFALDRTVLAPDGLHLIDAQAVVAQELAGQLNVIGRARLT